MRSTITTTSALALALLIAVAGAGLPTATAGTPSAGPLSFSVTDASASGGQVTLSMRLANDGSSTMYAPVIDLGSLPDGWGVASTDVGDGTFRDSTSEIVWLSLEPGESTSPSVTFDTPDGWTGTATISIDAHDSDDNRVSTETDVTVESSSGRDLDGDGNPSTDTDGDGKHEDVNGDGEFSILDVQVLFADVTGDRNSAGVDVYDFNGDERVSILDVQTLFADL